MTHAGGTRLISKQAIAPVVLGLVVVASVVVAAVIGRPVWAAALGSVLALVYWALEAFAWRRARARAARMAACIGAAGRPKSGDKWGRVHTSRRWCGRLGPLLHTVSPLPRSQLRTSHGRTHTFSLVPGRRAKACVGRSVALQDVVAIRPITAALSSSPSWSVSNQRRSAGGEGGVIEEGSRMPVDGRGNDDAVPRGAPTPARPQGQKVATVDEQRPRGAGRDGPPAQGGDLDLSKAGSGFERASSWALSARVHRPTLVTPARPPAPTSLPPSLPPAGRGHPRPVG